MAAVLAAGAAACGWASPGAAAQAGESKAAQDIDLAAVTIAIAPRDIEPEDLARIPGMSVGVMSAGLSNVSANQTYLDITQGNRVFTSLYGGDNPVVLRFGQRVPGWELILERAERAPAEIEPGLLAQTLWDREIPARADGALLTPAMIAADRIGVVPRTPAGQCVQQRCPGLAVVEAMLDQLKQMAERLEGDDLLIAIEKPPPPERDTLAIGIAGEGFGDGNLTSDNTRTDGFVLATDIAPTILERYGLEVPEVMSGQPIRAEGETDADAVGDRAERMSVVAGRRAEVILYNLIIWAALAGLAALLTRGREAPTALALLGLSVIYLPFMLLVGAGLQPSELGERLLVGLGAPALAGLTFLLHRRWEALAIACGVTVGAYALDIVTGSTLTAQSLLGPNPALGVRFFGIGNELESMLAIVIPIGVGAGLATYAQRSGRRPSPRVALAAFLGAGAFFAVLFAAGRFGADVGAAIVLPAGAAVAALAVPGALRRRGLVALIVAAPIAGLALLASFDLVLGGDAHLSRSVFEAGGADELANVFERRLRLSASSFNRATGQPLFWFAVAVVITAIVFRSRILAWLRPEPLVRAGFAGAAAATALGIVANDSGALFLIIGAIALLACVAFAYGQHARSQARDRAARA
jgi:hypothetical protein